MRNKLLLLTLCICSFFAVSAQQTPPESPKTDGAVATFTVSGHDFGKVAAHGGNVSFDFEYTNTGNKPLIITKIITSCSCTKASFSKKPLAPGAKGIVKMTFEPKTQRGTFCKLINVYSNSTEGAKIIYLKGTVE